MLDETVLRKKLLSTRLLNSIRKYEQQNGASIIFHKQSLLIIEQIIFGINIKSNKSTIKPEQIGKLFLYVNSLIEKIDYPLEESIEGANVVIRRSLFYYRTKSGQAFNEPRSLIIYEKIKHQRFDLNQML